jgi:hypothetical protein
MVAFRGLLVRTEDPVKGYNLDGLTFEKDLQSVGCRLLTLFFVVCCRLADLTMSRQSSRA